jgi:hypothetical protein
LKTDEGHFQKAGSEGTLRFYHSYGACELGLSPGSCPW